MDKLKAIGDVIETGDLTPEILTKYSKIINEARALNTSPMILLMMIASDQTLTPNQVGALSFIIGYEAQPRDSNDPREDEE